MKKLTLSKVINFFIGLAQKTGGEVGGEKSSSPDLVKKAREVAGEGIVLLKNDGVLPISKDKVVSVFGRVQNDYFYVGYGSGGDVKAPYKVSLMDGLRGGNFTVNEQLAVKYGEWCKQNPTDEGFWGHWPLCYDEMPLDDAFVAKMAEVSDVAIVVIGRAAGEDREQKLVKGGYLITDKEKSMLNLVTARFEKVVVIIDAGNIMDMSWVKDYGDKLSAIVYAWQGGMESGNAIADVLSGKVNPSGKLTDTIALNYTDYPSSNNFGNRKQNKYVEDIYVGYRYFSTFGNQNVLYPFGYGLSYTTFEKDTSLEYIDGKINVDVKVANTGNIAGKEVVLLYVCPPQGELGKACRNLVAFAKTNLIESGQSQVLHLCFDEYSMASFDEKGLTGHKNCYVLEGGEYAIYLGGDYMSAEQIATIKTNEKVVKECEEACAPIELFEVLYPHFEKGDFATQRYRQVQTKSQLSREKIQSRLPQEIEQIKNFKCSFSDVKVGDLSIDDFVATLDDDELETLLHGDYKMNSPLGKQGNAGAFGGISESLQSKGVPVAITTDGPSGIRLAEYASLLPCGTALASSMNQNLVCELYAELAKEMRLKGSDVLLAPGMNIHRDPLCGRNFEYFSEDPVVSGKMASAVVKGLQSQGVSACPKHFACNNQETNRNHNNSILSQRALREIYLKGFEICVKESAPLIMMTSYNKINGTYSYYNYDLATTILRDEWNYKGMLTTDWWTVSKKSPDFANMKHHAYRVRAQVDIVMPGGDRVLGKYDGSIMKSFNKGSLARAEMQRSAKNVLRFLLSNDATREKID